MSLPSTLLRIASWLVPSNHRPEWRAEWGGELWHVRRTCPQLAARFCFGAFRDALWMRRHVPSSARPALWLESPARCLGILALLAVVCVAMAFRYMPPGFPLPVRGPFFAMLYLAMMSLPMLAAMTRLGFGDFPVRRYARRWLFFAVKTALVMLIVFFGVLDIGAALGLKVAAGPIHFILFGNVAGLRWAILDQRRRCPECLRLLALPAQIGQPSQTFLEWYGTEFVCVKGHGLLHVPEIPTVSFRTQSWTHLDRSWSELF
ncbi:MAG: hypothetical protein QM757_02150 [Paludibaculum sp.]